MRPVATYRLQMHAGFPLASAEAIVPYLGSLGISHIHSSPLLAARAGSEHGYDVTDPTRVNPALGGEEALRSLAGSLASAGMGLVLDIVPNHMAASPENPFWEDVLTNGPASAWARWFDISWREGEGPMPGRVLLPVLGDLRSRVIERGELGLRLRDGRVRVVYYDHSWPTDPATVAPIVADAASIADGAGDGPELRAVARRLRDLPRRSARTVAERDLRAAEIDAIARRLGELARASGGTAHALELAVARWATGPDGARRLRRLLDAQAYRLVHWRRAAREINYRRFFDVNDLVSLHAEDPEVFGATHALPLEWLERGWVDGFRVDHPDGLLDPLAYLRRLDEAASVRRPGATTPVWVEKILARTERLRPEWPASGTTGYDFLNDCERVFVDPLGFARLCRHYHRIVRSATTFDAVARSAKRAVLESGLAAGVRQLAARIRRLLEVAGHAPLPARNALVVALVETIAALPVYRTYVDPSIPVPEDEDRALLVAALADARARGRGASAALEPLGAVLLGDETLRAVPAVEQLRLRAVQRFQQLSGPAAAKGIEDTAFYAWVPLLSLNEVGGGPEAIEHGDAVADLHASARHRAVQWPATLLALTTHDTKRSADVRARLATLSELPDAWEACLYRCRRLARSYQRAVHGRQAPDPNTTWLLYQTLVGMWPPQFAAPGAPLPDADCLNGLRERLSAYMLKATREAKQRTSWTDPDTEFEAAVEDYVAAVLDPVRGEGVLRELSRLVTRIGRPGLWGALARSVLQLTSPGIPDIYQGDEVWSFTLVDPDNRRPVDFGARRAALESVTARADGPSDVQRIRDMVASPEDGRIKVHIVRSTLGARRAVPALRDAGEYAPLMAEGARAPNVVAFSRQSGGSRAVVVVPRLLAAECGVEAPTASFWGDTTLTGLPGERWACALTGQAVETPGGRARLADLMPLIPAAVLIGSEG